MKALTGTFEHEGAIITVKRPDGFGQQRTWQLTRLLSNVDDSTLEGLEIEGVTADTLTTFGYEVAIYLANTVSIKGDLGFPVPLKDVTQADFLQFCAGLGRADFALTRKWDATIFDLRTATNDPDLLPPEEVSEKKGKAQKSE